jgi:hypothetical protein
MLKNAGIQSTTEAVQRLVVGEVFYYKGLELRFDPSLPHPFRNGESALVRGWDHYKQWEVPCQWYEALGEGVLCWVWNGNEMERQLRIVTWYDPSYDSRFRLRSGAWVEHATPMTSEEVKKFLWGEK